MTAQYLRTVPTRQSLQSPGLRTTSTVTSSQPCSSSAASLTVVAWICCNGSHHSSPVKRGFITISSEPNSPIGFVDSRKEIGYYKDATEFLGDEIETFIQQPVRLLPRESLIKPQEPHLRSTYQTKHDRETTHAWLRSRNECSGYQDANYTWNAPEPEDLLQNMLQEVETRHSAKYGEFLRCPGRFKELKDRILPRAWEFLKSKDYSRHKLLELTQEIESDDSGIYVHVIWLKSNPDHFYLYVGQSIELRNRIAIHRNPAYREKHRSLHYYIWDLASTEQSNEYEVEEEFVFLSVYKDEADPLLLNLLEFWCSLMLQTLTRNALLAYLPKGTLSPHAGMHLNVALPIYQTFQGEAVPDSLHGDIYNSMDPVVQQYYSNLRRKFFELKYSPNPLLRSYYEKAMHERQVNACTTKRKHSANRALQGMEVPVRFKQNRHGGTPQIITISHFNFTLSRKMAHVRNGDLVEVQCHLSHGIHDHRYARKSLATDSAARLGIHVEGVNSTSGETFTIWLHNDGELAVFRMNTLVDMLEGLDIWNPSDRMRRWIPRSASGRKQATFTQDVLQMIKTTMSASCGGSSSNSGSEVPQGGVDSDAC